MWQRGAKIENVSAGSNASNVQNKKKTKFTKSKRKETSDYNSSDYKSYEYYNSKKKYNKTDKQKQIEFSLDEFPELEACNVDVPKEKNSYSNICKNQSDTDKNNELQAGWVELKNERNKKFSENKETNNFEDEMTDEELIQRWNQTVNYLVNKYEEESYNYFEMYGQLDGYALAKIEREKYEKYAAQFELVEDEEDYEEYSDSDSDMSSVY